jgi:hypothetical protein
MKKITKILIITFIMLSVVSIAVFSQTGRRRGRSSNKTPQYTLTVTSNVSSAQIYLDGAYQKASPTHRFTLDEGTYTITLKAKGYEDGSATVNLNSDQSIRINLNPLKATIVPAKHHPDFIIIIDGKQQGSGPVQVLPGTHTIEFRIGALSAKGTYTFEAGETYRVQPTLGIDFNY